MAKDDYDVIVYKVLLYYYAVMKRKITFQESAFEKMLEKRNISDEYFADVIRLMASEGLIEGTAFIKSWGSNYILACDLSNISITAAGIRYLKDNSAMKKVKDTLVSVPGMIADLVGLMQL